MLTAKLQSTKYRPESTPTCSLRAPGTHVDGRHSFGISQEVEAVGGGYNPIFIDDASATDFLDCQRKRGLSIFFHIFFNRKIPLGKAAYTSRYYQLNINLDKTE